MKICAYTDTRSFKNKVQGLDVFLAANTLPSGRNEGMQEVCLGCTLTTSMGLKACRKCFWAANFPLP